MISLATLKSYEVLQRTIPYHCPYDNVYCLFPLCHPKKSEELIGKLFTDAEEKNKYIYDKPKRGPIKVLRTIEAIKEVFNDPKNFPSPYKQHLAELTGGYG